MTANDKPLISWETPMGTASSLDLTAMSLDDLRSLADRVAVEIVTRDVPAIEPPAEVTVTLATCSSFDSRKHGHAYVASLTMGEGRKIDRVFIAGSSRRWDSKRKYYSQDWEFPATIGTVLECRLNDGSWKNDYREWYVVESDGPRAINQTEAHDLLK